MPAPQRRTGTASRRATRSRRFRALARPIGPVTLALVASIAACAASGKGAPTNSQFNGSGGSSSTSSGGSSTVDDTLFDGSGGGFGDVGVTTKNDDVADTGRPPRCDDAGHCSCFNIASIGKPAHYGTGNDNTDAFVGWLNGESSASVVMFQDKPTLTDDFLANYDVVILQWLTDSNQGPYWNFSSDEIAALQKWVNAGGGLIAMSGYDSNSAEVTPLNQLLFFTDISYNTDTILSSCPSGDNCYCWGNTIPVSDWQAGPIGSNVTAIGALSGRSINPGAATVDASSGTTVYAAHETVGAGRVFAWCDEWVTYTSQWWGVGSDAGPDAMTPYNNPYDPCYMKAVSQVFQVPQWWYNVISYASAATQCPFVINDPSIVPR